VKYKFLLAALSLLGAGIILFATSHYGAGFSPDSVLYLSSARNLEMGKGINNLTISPPLYPVLLASIGIIFGKDPITIAHIINAVLFGFIIFLSGVLYYTQLKSSPGIALLGSILVLVSVPLIPVYLMAWTEPLFIFLILLYIILLDVYLKKETLVWLLFLSLSVILACLTRYIGIILIPLGTISILLYPSNLPNVIKIKHSFLFLLLSSIPIGVWAIKNYYISGTFFGTRYLSTYTYRQNLASTFDSLLSWYLPARIVDSRPLLLILGIVIGLIAGIGFKDGWFKDGIISIKKSPILLLVVIYPVSLVATSKTSFWQLIDNRYLSPLFIPLILLLLIFTEKFVSHLRASSSHYKRAIILFWISIGAGLIYPTFHTISGINDFNNNGGGFTNKSWQHSETIQYLLTNKIQDSGCTIYSNGADAIYLLMKSNVKSIPTKNMGAYVIADTSSLKNSWPQENKACIVWFKQITWRTYLFTPDELISVTNLEQVTKLDDGTIYFVSRK
jgi:hypothetical protein